MDFLISANPLAVGALDALFCCLAARGEGKLAGGDQKVKPVKSLGALGGLVARF